MSADTAKPMLGLERMNLFASLPADELERLKPAFDLRFFPTGSVVCRRGYPGIAFYAIAAGGVTIETGATSGASNGHLFFGPGQVFGELSLLSDAPVSATVIAAKDTWLMILPRLAFSQLLETQPVLVAALLKLLADRIRHRPGLPVPAGQTPCVLVIGPPQRTKAERFFQALVTAVERYAPGSLYVDACLPRPPSAWQIDQRPGFLPAGAKLWESSATASGSRVFHTDAADPWRRELVGAWRSTAAAGQILLLAVAHDEAAALAGLLHEGDAVLLHVDSAPAGSTGHPAGGFGLADVARFRIGAPATAGINDRGWCFSVPEAELDGLPRLPTQRSARLALPNLDWIGRWIAQKEIGIALGAGAARGLAHLGVLQALEDMQVPLDYLCGSSMGGAVALCYARVASASDAIDSARRAAGGNHEIVDLAWYPAASLLKGQKIRHYALNAMGDARFEQFLRPAAVVAADLVRRERFVFDAGPAAPALLATVAIPGLLPPVRHDGRILVDGALVSRVPVDLLQRRRCGLKLAVNVIPSAAQRSGRTALDAAGMEARFGRPFGLRHVLGASWELLAWWHGAHEAEHADLLFEPVTDGYSVCAFGSLERMIEAGRREVERKRELVEQCVAAVLKPGIP